MQYLRFNKKDFKIQGNYNIKQSNSEVTFQDVKIDFSDGTIMDIPYKYQECQIIKDNEVVFTGYVDVPKFAEMKTSADIEGRELTLTLLSPLKMATIRTITIIGTYSLKTAIQRVLQPLVDDGFIIKELNISEGQITLNFILQTVEYAMNNIGYKRNIFWFINEKKEIFINAIDYLFANKITKYITENDGKKEGLFYLQPTISDIDYANIINLKNLRLIYSSNNEFPIIDVGKKIKKGDSVTFKYPIVLDEETLRNRIAETNGYDDVNNYYTLQIAVRLANGGYKEYSFEINLNDKENLSYNKYRQNGSITFDDNGGNNGEIVLQRDNFFSNLITGFQWNVESEATIELAKSDTALRYTTMKFLYSNEIENLKGVISQSGQIEKTIDYAGKWTTLNQLITYARSLMVQNANTINQVVLKYDKNPDLKVGDIININKPSFFVQGNFAVKSLSYNYYNENDETWEITAKSSDLISSYIDMFRPAEQQENEGNVESMILSEFIEENFTEKHTIEDYESEEDKVIRLSKNAWLNEWGSIEEFSFDIVAQVSDIMYVVRVMNSETSQAMAWIDVNIENEECEVTW